MLPNSKFKIPDSKWDGFVALLTIVILGAATLLVAYTAALLGLGELDLGNTSQKGEEAFSVADGCMEEALRRLRINTSYSGGTINTSSSSSCSITASGIDPNRAITVTGTVTGTPITYNKKIEVTLTLIGNVITVNSWAELSS